MGGTALKTGQCDVVPLAKRAMDAMTAAAGPEDKDLWRQGVAHGHAIDTNTGGRAKD
jgi:hypothetical protein